MKGISVIICCYNSELRLPETLKHLFLQKELSNINWEIIVVDNASKDSSVLVTQDIYRDFAPSGIDLKIVEESRPGLSYARDRGLISSKYEYILYCDDDNWLNDLYVYRTYTFLEENESYAAVGGNGIEKCEVDPPKWFERFKSIYAIGCRNDGDVTNVYGAGMGVKKSLLDGFTYEMSDRKGKSLTSGGDSEMCHYFRAEGYKIRQQCTNTFYHFIPKERLTFKYLLRMASGRGKSKALLHLVRNNNDRSKIGIGYRLKVDVKLIWKALVKFDWYRICYNL